MPELPEVEVLRRDLLTKLPSPPRIACIRLLTLKLRTDLIIPKSVMAPALEITDIQRRSKFLIFTTNRGILISHLGMSGYWRVNKRYIKAKHDHIVIEWENGDYWIYNDPRRFGIFEYFKSEDQVTWFKSLGPEPFTDAFISKEMIKRIKKSDRVIKSIIMDAKVMVGVGNIYASESLHKAGINPFKISSRLSVKKVAQLLAVIRETLFKAIQEGGSSIRDYVHTDGKKGGFQNQHLVYGRAGQKCFECGSKIREKKCHGRSTFWCVECQA